VIRSVLVVVCVCAPLKGLADEPAFDLDQFFQEVNQAQTTVKYQAEQTIFEVSIPRIIVARFKVQYAYPYRKREQIDGTPETQVTLLEDGKYLWSYLPSRRLVLKKPLNAEAGILPAHFYEDIALIKKNYQVMKQGLVSSSNVTCQVLEFQPKQNDRPRREIWFEKERKIPIRIYVSTPEGQPVYIAVLENLEWNPKLDKDTFHLKVPLGTKVYEIIERGHLTPEQAQMLLQRPILLPTRVPCGFHPFNILFRSEGDLQRVQVVYTDGLSSFSIFQEWIHPPRDKAKEQPEAPPSVFPVQANPYIHHYGLLNILSYDLEGLRATLVGDINENGLLDTARSFSRSK
jgi:outer membrane lipoprotein-sorting protein